MFRILTSSCVALLLGCSCNAAQAASLSELLGLDEVLEAPAMANGLGGVGTNISQLLANQQVSGASNSTGSISVGGCTPPIFSSCGSPIIGVGSGGPSIIISINIDIDINFIGSFDQPVTSASRCN